MQCIAVIWHLITVRNDPVAVSVLDAEWDCKRGNGRLPETPLVLPGRECARLPRDPPVSSEQQPQGSVPVRDSYILWLKHTYTHRFNKCFSLIVNRIFNGWQRDAFSLKTWALRWAEIILTKQSPTMWTLLLVVFSICIMQIVILTQSTRQTFFIINQSLLVSFL